MDIQFLTDVILKSLKSFYCITSHLPIGISYIVANGVQLILHSGDCVLSTQSIHRFTGKTSPHFWIALLVLEQPVVLNCHDFSEILSKYSLLFSLWLEINPSGFCMVLITFCASVVVSTPHTPSTLIILLFAGASTDWETTGTGLFTINVRFSEQSAFSDC